jgi:M-phase inducer tyrosine phosphatase
MPVPGWGSNRDIFRSHSHAHFPAPSSNGALSLREQLHKNPGDYFNVKDLQGSSPAASLAADLSQNFRLDNEARYVAIIPECGILQSAHLD